MYLTISFFFLDMVLPLIVLDEVLDYLEVEDWHELRQISKYWNTLISKRVFQHFYAEGKEHQVDYSSILTKYSGYFKILSVSEDAFLQGPFDETTINFQLFSSIHSLRLLYFTKIPYYFLDLCKELKLIKHLSVFGLPNQISLDLHCHFSQLTSIYLLNVIYDFTKTSASFDMLESFTSSSDGDRLLIPGNIGKIFPRLLSFHLFFRAYDTDFSLLKLDWKKRLIRNVGFVSSEKAVISLEFYECDVALASEENIPDQVSLLFSQFIHTRLSDGTPTRPCIKECSFSTGVSRWVDGFRFILEEKRLTWISDLLLIMRWSAIDFKATKFKVISNVTACGNFFAWMSSGFPDLETLVVDAYIDTTGWTDDLSSLKYFYGSTSSLATLRRIIAHSPQIQEVHALLTLTQLTRLRAKFPGILFSYYAPKSFSNFERDSHILLNTRKSN
ncbi:hypothetical protein DSO57_1027755 [Entomophthora muscae]|uniref:Uncharacterized protein n=1 Tax=Entomophthora muscae TaxID=34485 RepID=A0ACC2RGF9_9FUNG|nr:hypothetical protein DSO57_1027755 [Entomophthora muscae]